MSKLPLPPRSRPLFAPKALTATEVKAKADKAEKPPKAKDDAKVVKRAADRADKRKPKPSKEGDSYADKLKAPHPFEVEREKNRAKLKATGEAMGVFGVRLPKPMADKLRKIAKARKVAPAVIVREVLEKHL